MDDVDQFNAAQEAGERDTCTLIARELDRDLPDAECRVWHAHPVWFLDGNPIVGYSCLTDGINLLFWSGQSFEESGLQPQGKLQAAEIRYTVPEQDEEDSTASGGIALFINADDYLGSWDIELDWRFIDNAPVRRQRWRASTGGDAVFNLSYKPHFLTQMVDAERLTVRIYDYRGTSLEYAFDVKGARAAVNRLGCYLGDAL